MCVYMLNALLCFVQKLVLHVLALESSTFHTQQSDTKIAISANTTYHFRS